MESRLDGVYEENLALDPPTQTIAGHAQSFTTLGLHADDSIHEGFDIAPPIHVSSIFRYATDPDKLRPADEEHVAYRAAGSHTPADSHIYSRHSGPNTSRLELILTSTIGGPCLTYTSGIAAFHALIVYLHPKVVAIGAGYHGCHNVLKIYQKLTNCKIVDLFDEKTWDEAKLGPGDVVHLETPINPTGVAYNIRHFAERAHAYGAVLTVDATFAPPPLQNPFDSGADFVLHSGSKYLGGHSDMLCGVIGVSRQYAKAEEAYWGLYHERVNLGAVMGSLEGWLGIRSVRTLGLRVQRQSQSAEKLVQFFSQCIAEGGQEESKPNGNANGDANGIPLTEQPADHTSITTTNQANGTSHIDPETAAAVRAVVWKVEHASLQQKDMDWLRPQMPNGFGPVFALWLRDPAVARRFPSHLTFFAHATSLGGVESLIEWRRMSDPDIDKRLCRVSVGIEDWTDLRDDLVRACREIAAKSKKAAS